MSEPASSRASTDIESVVYIYAVSLEHPASWGLSVSFAPLEKPLRGENLKSVGILAIARKSFWIVPK